MISIEFKEQNSAGDILRRNLEECNVWCIEEAGLPNPTSRGVSESLLKEKGWLQAMSLSG